MASSAQFRGQREAGKKPKDFDTAERALVQDPSRRLSDDTNTRIAEQKKKVKALLGGHDTYVRSLIEETRGLDNDDSIPGSTDHAMTDPPLQSQQRNVMSDIEQCVLTGLEAQEDNQYEASFCVQWNPRKFMKNQFGEDHVQLGKVLTITGSEHCAQATTCENYVRYTWPYLGSFLLQIVQDVFSHPEHDGQSTIHSSHPSLYRNLTDFSQYSCRSLYINSTSKKILACVS